MQNFGQERQCHDNDDLSFTPLSAACFDIVACGVRDRDLALIIERLEYLAQVCHHNNLDSAPDWLRSVELIVERAAEKWRSIDDCRNGTHEFELYLSKCRISAGSLEPVEIGNGNARNNTTAENERGPSDYKTVIQNLRDLVDTLVCEGSPEAHLLCKELYEDLALLNKGAEAPTVCSPKQSQISPLSSVISSSSVNQLLRDFNSFRISVIVAPEAIHDLTLSATDLNEARRELELLSLKEEKGLHLLAGLLCHRYLGDRVTIEAQVYLKDNPDNEDDSSRSFKQLLSRCELFTRSDLQIAETISGKSAELLGASIIEYRSTDAEPGDMVHAVRTRLKSWESLIDKVTERMFEGNTITDLSGIAIIVDSEDDVRKIYEQLVRLRWSDSELKNMGLEPSDSIRGLNIFKTSDKLGVEHINWRGIKVAGFWGDQCVEIQIKTLDFLRREQASDTPESHSSYRKDRESRREESARSDPMYNLSRQFVKFALLGGDPPSDIPPNVRLNLIP